MGGVSSVDWPDDRLDAQRPYAAAKIGELVADFPRWVHRRVETIVFIDDTRVRRHTSVDFTLPHFPSPRDGRPTRESELVPISLIRKDVLRALDVRSEEGAALPVLTRSENAALAADVLVENARETLLERAGDESLDRWVEYGLRMLAGDAQARPGGSASPQAAAQWESLFSDDALGGLIENIDRQFILLVPLTDRLRDRRVVKFGYEERLARPARRGAARIQGAVLDALESLGLLAFVWAAEVTAMFDCESYHAEVVVPDELVILRASLIVGDGIELAFDGPGSRIHLHPNPMTDRPPATSGVVHAEINLRASLLWPVVLVTLLTAATLGAGLVVHLEWGIGAQADAAAGLLVAVPAFFAPFVAPGGHPLVRRMFKGLRVAVLASALISFSAAAVVELSFGESTTLTIWRVLFAAALVPFLAAVTSLYWALRAGAV
jgi:hypothetical protein